MSGRKKRRIRVVVDTNVFIGNFLARHQSSPNRQVIRLWLIERRFRLALSREITGEYLRIFEEVLGFDTKQIASWYQRFTDSRRVHRVSLGSHPSGSRDPEDNLFLATALTAKADFLVTNDKDLLMLPDDIKRRFTFKIVQPDEFLEWREKYL